MNDEKNKTHDQLSTDREQFSSYEQADPESPDIQDIHRAVLREQFEPSEGQQRVPIALFLFFIALAMWGGYYLSKYDGNFQANVYDGPDAFRLMDLSQAGEKKEKQIDPILLGKRIYNNCVSCHQASGEGVAGQYPPLNQSEWVLGDDRILARILLGGLNGPIEVKGTTYNAQMPAWKQLSDRDIAAVLTFIRQNWNNTAPAVEESTIANVRASIGTRASAYSASELKAIELPDRSEAAATETTPMESEAAESETAESQTAKSKTNLEASK
ncbi:Cytochrome c, mono-and diheme variants [Neorhodopirellula lusitana]|uniref:Cytochrome c, mono-and diheme variants n=1 Tax=Neorhodopirellula lusitana TaxID=445327 RepID=A0ABY1Q625_9BACT|nr:cytochrome c [Neorhodopirellula lusitana]SMP60966.1 Cytochrome c, mono-and diheme variants [Neorhodopirellula lusitana]